MTWNASYHPFSVRRGQTNVDRVIFVVSKPTPTSAQPDYEPNVVLKTVRETWQPRPSKLPLARRPATVALREPAHLPPPPVADTRQIAVQLPQRHHAREPEEKLDHSPPSKAIEARTVDTASALAIPSVETSGANVDQLPCPAKTNPTPPYPAEALAAGRTGRVLLRVLVAADGTVTSVKIERSSGTDQLDASARSTVERWRFEPARRMGQAVPYEVILPIRFTIRSPR